MQHTHVLNTEKLHSNRPSGCQLTHLVSESHSTVNRLTVDVIRCHYGFMETRAEARGQPATTRCARQLPRDKEQEHLS